MSWHQERCSGLWRSEDMVRVDIILQREVLHDTMFEVGMLGRVQFIDMNEGLVAFSRPFTGELRRCEELQRKLHFIEESIRKETDLLQKYTADINMCIPVEEMRSSLLQGQAYMIDSRIESTVNDLSAMITSLEGLQREMNENHEVKLLYHKYRLMVEVPTEGISDHTESARHSASFSSEAFSRLASLFGVIDTARSEEVYRLCYRVTRGNAIVEISNEPATFLDVQTGKRTVLKTVFVVLSASPSMITRLRKLVSGIGGDVYTLEEVRSRGAELTTAGTTRHIENTIEGIRRRRRDVLAQWYEEHRVYKTYLKVEKALLTAMNMCSMSGSTCNASAWVPMRHEQSIRRALQDAVSSANGSVESILTLHADQRHPPTFFETNRFTESFQGIVDSYGIARYKEVNPGVFTIITFPYLFGIMFGDIGHGLLLLLIALFLISKEKDWRRVRLNEILAMVFGGRYLLLLMSFFAIYMGLLYNDFFGISLNLFSSGYTWTPIAEQHGITYPTAPNGLPSVKPLRVYAMGLDAAWAETENKLELYNSIKMKHAVIVGVVQMFAGLFLFCNNNLRERDWYKIVLLFVPEFVFLSCTFGYMAILIIVKWCHPWESTHKAPSILEAMTGFFLQPGSVANPLFRGQAGLQVFLLIVAFSMVPIMLLGMPYVEIRNYRRWLRRLEAGRRCDREGAESAGPDTIESIEFAHGFFNDPSAVVQHRQSQSGDDASQRRFLMSGEDDVVGIFFESDSNFYVTGTGAHDSGGGGSGATAAQREKNKFEHFDASEVCIHYMIHTFEHILGSVSNTASYLRLWALSLAHAQLSEVFMSFTVVKALSVDSSGAVIAVAVLFWLAATLAVLVGMEGLSAFLHALRLHWVEFQNKFYAGDGWAFDPMNLLRLDMEV